MDIVTFANTKIGYIFVQIMASLMESRFRYRFFSPTRILKGSDIHSGQTVLEVGCGTGFFTPHVAQLIGDQGSLVAMDILPMSVEAVTKKVQTANLRNVRVIVGDALNTQLAAESLDAVLIFGVIPAPALPMDRLLPEMKRILKPGGTMAVWPSSWVHKTIIQSGLFTFSSRWDCVFNYKRT
jgi:demethylmenaquinone methyltransferase/2-methoxy-6-polyprenyl-1,4-benzoquinol methylase